MRVDMAAVGVSSLNFYNEDREDEGKIGFPSHHLRAIDYLPWSSCTAELAKYNQTLPGISKEEHVCLQNDQWIIPGSCGFLPGGPVQRYVARSRAFLKYVYALSLAGRSCGYGIPAVAILLQPHIPWLRSVIMDDITPTTGQEQPSDSVIIINPDLKRSDECNNGDGTIGICVPHEMCLSTPERLRKGERVTLCSVGSVVCCPWGDIARNAAENPVRTELGSCESRSRTFREQRLLGSMNSTAFTNLPHAAEIGWPVNNGKIAFHCIGYLITTNTIISSASCAEFQPRKPSVARIGSLNADDTANYLLQPIRRVTVHEDYDDETGLNNLALIQLTAHIKPTAFYFPGCLFTNTTHVPVRQFGIIYAQSSVEFARIYPMYGKDCQERRDGEAVGKGQICYLKGASESSFRTYGNCFRPGDLMVWSKSIEEDLDDPEYLVAIFNHGSCAKQDDVQIATRIASHYDWIVNNIK
ncbi:hypothetical protein ZHAS_00015605 [Anopheles sinensis]|uniref:Peptidase S1 domain-containing protein n=1 Tax=Anopheles sinensis TaxID=74873 RepID=A0A084WAW8_ANOSI|nr:hypothetical protein ZHAS_00015605 [Anopheles sinensis]